MQNGMEKIALEYPFKTRPYQHQLDVWRLSKDKINWALFLDLGTGKSKVLLDTAAHLYDNGKINGLAIIAPNGCKDIWEEVELSRHLPDHVQYDVATWSSTTNKDSTKKLAKLSKSSERLHVLVMNVEALVSDRAKKFLENFLLGHNTLLCVDESTTIKNTRAKRTRTLLKLGRLAKFRRIMSGNPIPNGPLDIFSQGEFLEPGLLGSSYFGFRNRYAILVPMNLGGRKFQKIVGYQDLDALHRQINSFATVIKKSDCLDLPPKIYQDRAVQMTSDQLHAYNDMLRDSVVELESSNVTAEIVLTKLLRLHQITCGFLADDAGGTHSFEKNPKITELMQVLNETSGKIIVWATYRHNIKQIVEAIGKEYGPMSVAHYYGETSDNDRATARRDFEDPSSPLRFFVGNPATGRYGLTLVAASTVIYYSSSYDLEMREQSEDRCHRIGQKSASVNYIDLCCRGTVDEKILKVLKAKKKLTDQVVTSNWQWLLGVDGLLK